MIVAQLVVATRWQPSYDLARHTISDLGAVGCGTIQAAGGPVEVCSPWHALMNASFVVIGSLLALGALLAAPSLLRTTAGTARVLAGAAALLLVVAGISSAAVGFVPLDVDGDLHTLVATPLFVAQPLALLALGAVAVRAGRRGLGVALLATGLVAVAGALAFGASIATGDVGGLSERIALWPCQFGLGALGWAVVRSGRGGVWETEA